jgi:Flp pilus assembly protein TadG
MQECGVVTSIFTAMAGKALMRRRRRRFVRDERGATAVEFALLAAPFFMIIGAILETSVVFLSGQVLDGAVQDVSRLIRTGQVREMGINSADAFKARVCDRLFGLFRDCDNLFVEVAVQSNGAFSDIAISPPIDLENCRQDACEWTRPEAFNGGVGSSIVVVQVYYKWPTIIDFGGYNLGNLGDGTRLMSGTTVLRNEPFT